MPAIPEVREGDIGTVFEVTIEDDGVAVDISSAAEGTADTTINLLPPDGTKKTFDSTVSFTTDGTDGKIQFPTVSGTLDEPGLWRIQATVVPGANTFSSEIGKFRVTPNIE